MPASRRSLIQQQAYRDGYEAGRRDRDGEADKPLTVDQVARMTTDEINANWEAVQEALSANRREGDAE